MKEWVKRPRRNQGPRVNEQIRIPECRLIKYDGQAYGVVSLSDARRIAEEEGLDLVEVSPNASPPVVKIIDYGKYKYDKQKKKSESKKRQVVTQLKEIQFRPNIETHDLETKLSHVHKFLLQGDKVKLVMQFRGREMAYKDIGLGKFNGIIDRVLAMGAVCESESKMINNRIIVILAPDKKRIKQLEKERQAAIKNNDVSKADS